MRIERAAPPQPPATGIRRPGRGHVRPGALAAIVLAALVAMTGLGAIAPASAEATTTVPDPVAAPDPVEMAPAIT